MEIKFTKLFIEGFGSYRDPIKINLDRDGLNIIKGKNGAGKTTQFSALYWGLFKQNLKGVVNDKLPTWEQDRTDAFRGTRVVVEFEKGKDTYKIARHIKFKGTTSGYKPETKALVFKNGELDNKAMHSPDVDDYIEEILGVNGRIFINSIIFGQRMTRLIEAPNDEKRKLLEELFEMEFIELAKERAKVTVNELTEKLVKCGTGIMQANTSIENLGREITEKEEQISVFQADKTVKLSEAREKVEAVSSAILKTEMDVKSTQKIVDKFKAAKTDTSKLETACKELSDIYQLGETRVEELNGKVVAKSTELANTKTLLEQSDQNVLNLEADLKGVDKSCPYCTQPLTKEHVTKVQNEIKNKIKKEHLVQKELQPTLNGINAEIDTVGEALKSLKDTQQIAYNKMVAKQLDLDDVLDASEGEDKSTDLAVLKERVNIYRNNLADAKGNLAGVEALQPPNFDIKGLKTALANNQKSRDKFAHDKIDIEAEKEHYSWWASKGFASGGMKAFIFKSMLTQLNKHTEKYANRIGLNVTFSVDLSKASKPFTTLVYKGGSIVDYAQLSGGEKQLIDVCLAFSMHDLVSYSNKFNILAMDEVMEGLDDINIEVVFDLIRSKAGAGKSVYLITHSSDLDTMNSRTINVIKNGKTTTIK